MAVFIILIFVLIIQGHYMALKWENYAKVYMVLAFLELQFVSGLRLPVGDDTEYYVDTFVDISNMSFFDIWSHGLEKGFVFFCYLLSLISKNPQMIVFFSSFLINALVLYYIYKKSRIPWLSVVLYVTLMFYFSSMTLMRFAIACSILLYANDFIVKRDLVRCLIVVLIASSFHFSSFFYLILYFIYPLTLNTKNFAIISIPFCLLSIFLSLAFSLIIQVHERFTSYDGGIGEFYQSSFANLLIFAQSLLLFLFVLRKERWQLSSFTDENKLFLWTLFITVVISLMAVRVMMLTRFVTMLSLIQFVFIPNLLWKDYRTPTYVSLTSVILSITILQVVVILAFRPEWYLVTPYHNVLFY